MLKNRKSDRKSSSSSTKSGAQSQDPVGSDAELSEGRRSLPRAVSSPNQIEDPDDVPLKKKHISSSASSESQLSGKTQKSKFQSKKKQKHKNKQSSSPDATTESDRDKSPSTVDRYTNNERSESVTGNADNGVDKVDNVSLSRSNLGEGITKECSVTLSSPGRDYWKALNPVADQVFITDVTVNLETVTIRECKTEKGFFRDKDPKADIYQ